jgi:hypothetical protein
MFGAARNDASVTRVDMRDASASSGEELAVGAPGKMFNPGDARFENGLRFTIPGIPQAHTPIFASGHQQRVVRTDRKRQRAVGVSLTLPA